MTGQLDLFRQPQPEPTPADGDEPEPLPPPGRRGSTQLRGPLPGTTFEDIFGEDA